MLQIIIARLMKMLTRRGVLVEDMGLVPGNRVLLRGPNSPWMAACWFAIVKAGGIVVATMPGDGAVMNVSGKSTQKTAMIATMPNVPP